MDDEPDVGVDANGPEIRVFGPLQLVKAQARVGRVELQVERGCLYRLLLLSGQLAEAIGKGVGNAEFHHLTRKTFITSSPRWLMTLTAMRPDAGLANGRDTS